MSDEEDPFADLGKTLDDPPAQDAPDSSQGSETPSRDTSDGQGGGPADHNTPDENPTETPDPLTDPAFSYEEAGQRPFYARNETIADFDAWLNYELERDLSDRGYQNIVVREMTDALLRTVVEEDLIDEVADRFELARETAFSD